ncbi:hypothetical protein KCP70_24980 [Salmonella enterica subsp. enterica]|nr:hypothetical protein KCP70_24980 [Salmonella enterica subsp. enterica]
MRPARLLINVHQIYHVQVEDATCYHTPLPAGEEGKVIERHYVRELQVLKRSGRRSKPRHIGYQSDMPPRHKAPAVQSDGHWVERVLRPISAMMPVRSNYILKQSGPDDKTSGEGYRTTTSAVRQYCAEGHFCGGALRRVLKKPPTEALLRQSSEQKCEPERFV